jgi:hypothetical protein
MGGVGGHQVGIEAVSALLTAAARTLNYETWNAETLASSFGDELGFTVDLEHACEAKRVPGTSGRELRLLADLSESGGVPASGWDRLRR